MLVPPRGKLSATDIISHTLAHKQTPTHIAVNTQRRSNWSAQHGANNVTRRSRSLSLSHSGWYAQKEASYKFNYDAGIHTHHHTHSYIYIYICMYASCVCRTHMSVPEWALAEQITLPPHNRTQYPPLLSQCVPLVLSFPSSCTYVVIFTLEKIPHDHFNGLRV